MALIRWEPAAELGTIQNEMNRLFNTFFDQPAATAAAGATGRRWIPAMDLVETADQYVLRADLPGLSDDDVNVQLEDNVLTISGERKAHQEQQVEGYYRIERASGAFARSLALPEGVEPATCRPTSTAGCWRSGSPSPSRKSPGRCRSLSAAVQPTPRRSRTPTPPTRRPTAATPSQHPPDPT